jgi:hypothetical protein
MSTSHRTRDGNDPRALAVSGEEFHVLRRAHLRRLLDDLEDLTNIVRELRDRAGDSPADLGEDAAVIAGIVRDDLTALDVVGWV